jgi:acetyl esterase/lipase
MVSRPSLRSWLSLGLTVPAAFLAMWIIAPAPNRALLTLAVGAPELSAWLLVMAGLGLVVAPADVRRRMTARWSAGFALVAISVSVSPFVRFRGVSDAAERSLRMAFGDDYLERIPATPRAQFRPATLVVSSLFRGLGTPAAAVTITHGVKMTRPDSVELTMDVYQPQTPGEHPVLVQIYGGAWQRGQPSDFAEFAQYIAAQGYVVFAIDYRHAPRFVYPMQINDVRSALTALAANAARWGGDMSHLALIGR